MGLVVEEGTREGAGERGTARAAAGKSLHRRWWGGNNKGEAHFFILLFRWGQSDRGCRVVVRGNARWADGWGVDAGGDDDDVGGEERTRPFAGPSGGGEGA